MWPIRFLKKHNSKINYDFTINIINLTSFDQEFKIKNIKKKIYTFFKVGYKLKSITRSIY